MDKYKNLGQIFTKEHIVYLMLSLIQNKGNVLEPSCGNGQFFNKLTNCTGIEFDSEVCPRDGYNIDFFDYGILNQFDTIIGNPPFVKYNNINKNTKQKINNSKIYNQLFDDRTNLYCYFIYKCIEHLTENGELIFITPREFLKTTSTIKMNNVLYNSGTITHLYDLGDSRIFDNFTPNCIIWRFEKNNFSRITNFVNIQANNDGYKIIDSTDKQFVNMNGQLTFLKSTYSVPLNKIFDVKVGGVSGNNEIFYNENGNIDIVVSETFTTGKLAKAFYNIKNKYLFQHKHILLNRKIKIFNENNWFEWGRKCVESDDPRIYVNCKTRRMMPFFQNACKYYDGSVLGLFPKNNNINIQELLNDLNNVDWNELGFTCGNRFIFSQKALENCKLPATFAKYINE